MRKILLMSSALVVSGLLSGVAEAACIQTPTCSSLGYTSSSSCTGGIKCPFGNAWNCTIINKITELTNKITTIEKKITVIEENGSGGTNPAIGDCVVGAILNADKTCSSEIISGKTPIGVVFHAERRLAMGLETSWKEWSPNGFTVPGVVMYTSNVTTEDWNGKENTKLIMEYCRANNYGCPAIEYASNYKREGTSVGDWYLPAAAEVRAMYENMEVLNETIAKVGGPGITSDDEYWSSSMHSKGEVWYIDFFFGNSVHESHIYHYDVRPVLAF